MLSEEFKVKTVLLPIEVPPDIYCWKFGYVKDEMTVCGYFNNDGGHSCCLLHLGEIGTDLEGMLKPNKCLNLKVSLRAVLDATEEGAR